MLRLQPFFLSGLLVICMLNSATAQRPRSSIIIGESLADTKEPKPGKLDSPFGVDFDADNHKTVKILKRVKIIKRVKDLRHKSYFRTLNPTLNFESYFKL